MRPRPWIISLALITLSSIHAFWGIRMLGTANLLVGGSQVVSAGALLFAAAGASSRRTLFVGLALATVATSVRFLAQLSSPGPFLPITGVLVAGMAIAAWGARAVDDARPGPLPPMAFRGGFLVMGIAYLGFAVVAMVRFGDGPSIDTLDLFIRAVAASVCAFFVDAPAIAIDERKRFDEGGPMRAP